MSVRSQAAVRAALLQQLALATRRGFAPIEVVRMLRLDPDWSRAERAALIRVEQALAGGKGLADAIAGEPRLFASQTVQLVEAAAALGNDTLARMLDTLAVDARRAAEASRMKAVALSWPLSLGVVLTIVLAVWSIFIRPATEEAYASFNADLPQPAVLGALLARWWAWLPLLLLVALAAINGWLPRPLRRGVEAAVGGLLFVDRYRIARTSRRLLLWLHATAAQPALRDVALAHVVATADTAIAARLVDGVRADLARGDLLGVALGKQGRLPGRLGLFARLGEQMDTLADTLAELADSSEADEALALARFERGTLLTCYLAIGVLVGSALMSMYLPIFKLGLII